MQKGNQKNKLIGAILVAEIRFLIDEANYDRFTRVLENGFKGYRTFTIKELVQQCKDYDIDPEEL